MGNSLRGEVGFEAGGNAYTLRFGVNTLIALEEATDQTVDDIIGALKAGPKLKLWRQMFWFGLQENHADQVSEEEAGNLMDALGFAKATNLVGEAFGKAFPSAEPADPQKPAAEAGEAPTPRKAKPGVNGTGKSSSASGASLA